MIKYVLMFNLSILAFLCFFAFFWKKLNHQLSLSIATTLILKDNFNFNDYGKKHFIIYDYLNIVFILNFWKIKFELKLILYPC